MLFRDDRQLNLVCRALCARVGVLHLWGTSGPTAEGSRVLGTEAGRSLPIEVRVVAVAAYGLWSRGEGWPMPELAAIGDHAPVHLPVVFALQPWVSLSAERAEPMFDRGDEDIDSLRRKGHDKIDEWLATYGEPTPPAN